MAEADQHWRMPLVHHSEIYSYLSVVEMMEECIWESLLVEECWIHVLGLDSYPKALAQSVVSLLGQNMVSVKQLSVR